MSSTRQGKTLRLLREFSSRVYTSLDLTAIYGTTFELLDDHFGFKHVMILLRKPSEEDRLQVVASHGYDGAGFGAEVVVGKGIVGIVAKHKRLIRMGNVLQNRRYARALKTNPGAVPLPGIQDCKSKLAVPLLVLDELVGVLAVESSVLSTFDDRDEELLQLIGNQIGIAINNAQQFSQVEATNAQLQDLNENLEAKVAQRTRSLARQLEQNELLLKEIHHRVKNNLSVISALLRLQSAKLTDSGARQAMLASQTRVSSMALLHQKLYQGKNLGGIEMNDYLATLSDRLLETYGASERMRVDLQVPNLQLDIDQAVPLGLIVNELVTNIIKYAYPAGKGCDTEAPKLEVIEIGLQLVDGHYCLRIRDYGVGKAQSSDTHGTGFGGQLVSLLTHQLGGQLTESDDCGLLTELTFPRLES
ncbi:MAG: histidine kinase dimerization/phosphoacceptor domain -containing protein [Bacteroidota bacterium]